MEVKKPKTIAQVAAQVRESRRQYRQQMLRSMIAEVLPKGDYARLYEDVAHCFKRCNLQVPSGFTLFLSDRERIELLKETIADKRIEVVYSDRVAEGQISLVPRVQIQGKSVGR